MNAAPQKIGLVEWDARYAALQSGGLIEPGYGGPLRRHLGDGDRRLCSLQYDNSPAALRLWNFVLSEEDRLRAARAAGHTIIGCMKDLGTVPVIAGAFKQVTAFYPDGAWWLPCIEVSTELLQIADQVGVDDSFCPVRAMLGAFLRESNFPIPDLLICSAGAVCDDYSTIAQRLEPLGYPITWWEIPRRRPPDRNEPAIELPGGHVAPVSQVRFVRVQLQRAIEAIEDVVGIRASDAALAASIAATNRVRAVLQEIRDVGFTAEPGPMPGLELMLAEMLAIHFCSDRPEAHAVLEELRDEIRRRVRAGTGVLERDTARIFWINPVADLRVVNVLEDVGGRVCGTDYLFLHALDPIPELPDPLEALARTALADPMVGGARERARRVCADVRRLGSEAIVISRIPGASHCATEGGVIAEVARSELDIPVLEMEVPPVSDAMLPSLRNRLEALVETVKGRR